MTRIAQAFAKAKAEGRPALIVYLCAGDPDLASLPALAAAAAESADIVEIGMPFSDPTADGPTIQRASERALRRGTSMAGVLGAVRALRQQSDVPLVLYSYYHPLLAYGEARFADEAAAAGIDALLPVDLPPEENGPLRRCLDAKGMGLVSLVAPNSSPRRVQLAADGATAFLYYVSLTGVTGAATDLRAAAARARELKHLTSLPVAVGFGIKTADDVRQLAGSADAVVVGSVIVQAIEDAPTPAAAIDAVRRCGAELRRGAQPPTS